MIASLPMYDRAETSGANDRLWALIRDGLSVRGIAAPEALTHGAPDLWPHWTSPDLVLSQACGYPFRSRLHGTVTLVGTPDYGVEGCPPGHYRSVLVVRSDDPREGLGDYADAGFAYNEALSQSGYAAPLTHAAGLGLTLTPVLETGSHRASAHAVAAGDADIAAVDAVTWRMLQRWEPGMEALRVLALTEPTPGLPLIAAAGADRQALFETVAAAIEALTPQDRDLLGVQGLVLIPEEAYLAVPSPEAPAALAAQKQAASPLS